MFEMRGHRGRARPCHVGLLDTADGTDAMSTPDLDALLEQLNQLENIRDPLRSMSAKRQFQRFVIRAEAELRPIGGRRLDLAPLPVQVRDISRGGIGFLCSQPLETGSNWRVCFFNRGFLMGQQAVVVRHCCEIGGGVYLCGGVFVIDDGLLVQLGVDPAELVGNASEDSDDNGEFLPPAEVA